MEGPERQNRKAPGKCWINRRQLSHNWYKRDELILGLRQFSTMEITIEGSFLVQEWTRIMSDYWSHIIPDKQLYETERTDNPKHRPSLQNGSRSDSVFNQLSLLKHDNLGFRASNLDKARQTTSHRRHDKISKSETVPHKTSKFQEWPPAPAEGGRG